ncbi:MAG: hypothetical protein ABIO70_32545 [Pseudomonadota bacterium]
MSARAPRPRQPRLPFPRKLRFLPREVVVDALDLQGLYHQQVARQLGLSRGYWSTLVNRHHPVSNRIRAALLACPAFAGLGEAELWDIIEQIPEVNP